MFAIQDYPSFIAVILVFQLAPGAGTITILNATARNGVGAGFAAVLGTLAGDFVYMTAAVAGLAAVLKTTPAIFTGLQWLGAAYLCWVGLQILRTREGAPHATAKPLKSRWAWGRQAFAVSLTNPKVMLFFLALFPLFLRPVSSALNLAVMMAHVTTLSFLYQAGLVLGGNAIARRLQTIPAARKWGIKLAGAALVGFGIKLAAAGR